MIYINLALIVCQPVDWLVLFITEVLNFFCICCKLLPLKLSGTFTRCIQHLVIICDVTNLLLYILSKIERISLVSLETIESEFYLCSL